MNRENTLGFYDLMNIAEQNAEQTSKKAKTQKYASFECPKPKKLDPKQKVLSTNIQKFLARQQEEKLRAEEEARKKKAKLLEIRSQDKKATKRVGQMLRMTKSANKSVLAEAKSSLEDSLVEQDGYQPDEDDYGYVSQHAAEYHKKMMEKYRAMGANKPPPNPTKTPDGIPVPQSKSLKNSSKPSSETQDTETKSPDVQGRKPKQQRPGPTPVNFETLLKIAETNCKDPPKFEIPKIKQTNRDEAKYEFGRPMTAKEKAEYALEQEVRRKIAKGVFNPSAKKPASSSQPSTSRDAKLNKTTPNPVKVSNPTPNSSSKTSSVISPKKPQEVAAPKAPRINSDKIQSRRISNEYSPSTSVKNTSIQQEHVSITLPTNHKKSSPIKAPSLRNPSDYDNRSPRYQTSTNGRIEDRSKRSEVHNQHDMKRKHENLSSDRGHSSAPKKSRQVIDSEDEEEDDEYDSEMDDFIDDSDLGAAQISDLIRSITGYDKNKYKNTSDDECMESSVWQQMREEQKSLRIGIKEDLEDIRREEEEKKRKQMMMKKKKHR